MPYVQYPNLDGQRVQLLQDILLAADQDASDGIHYLPPHLVTEIRNFASNYSLLYDSFSRAKRSYHRHVTRKNNLSLELKEYVRDFWSGLARRIRRQKKLASVFSFYGLPLSGKRPRPSKEDEWVEWARLIVVGEADAIADGEPPMCNPSAAEVEGVYDDFRHALQTTREALATYDQLQNQVEAERPQADRLIRVVSLQLNTSLFDLPADDVRHIKKSYGFRYRESPNEK